MTYKPKFNREPVSVNLDDEGSRRALTLIANLFLYTG
jgi:hypothetical protein